MTVTGLVEEFCALLRKAGVRVSTPEIIDAVRAVEVVGIADRRRVRAAISACVIKRAADRAAFDELFDLYFSLGPGLDRDGALAESVIDALREAAAGMSPIARAGAGLAAPEIPALIRAAGASTSLAEISSPLQIGYYTHRMLEELDVSGADAELAALIERLRAAGAVEQDAADQFARLVADNLRRLRAAVRDWVQREFSRQNVGFMQQVATAALGDKPLAQLSESEIADLRAEVRRLARRLRARLSLRRVISRRGRLDLGRTLRRSLAAGGVPFELPRRTRHRRKPRLIVLCDISDSVRNVSRFMLQFVYTLAELFDRVQSFAFVAEIGELTQLFRRYDLDRAVDMAYSGAVVNVFANSNYGRALRAFAERHIHEVTRRTTVLVIGDGRNNYHPAEAAILGQIRRRAHRLWWLNPESPAAWGFGDSAMSEYRAHCDKIVVARNLSTLQKVVDELVM